MSLSSDRGRGRAGEATDCPECNGPVLVDHQRGERTCDDCGLVVEEDRVDPGPEWRSLGTEAGESRSRVGAPVTNTRHDRGLSTTIDWRDRDAAGETLPSGKRERMQRLRTWDERFRTRSSRDRTLKMALGEIQRMASALELPEAVREGASTVFRRALDEDLLPGRSVEGVATACVYVGARRGEVPRSLDELARVSRVDRREIGRAYRYLVRELDLGVERAAPEAYLGRFTSELGLPPEVEFRAVELLELGRDGGVHTGKSPVSLAAAAIYAAALLEEERITQPEVAEATDVGEGTIRKRYRELLEADPDHPL